MSFLGPIGLLNKRLTIEQVSTVPDATGQPIETWSPLMTVWGRVMPQRGGERFIAHQTIGRAVSTIRIRYRSGLTIDTTRILFDGRTWDIHDLRTIGMNEGLEMDVSARAEG